MKIVVIAPDGVLDPIKQSFTNRGCVGVEFEYTSDILDVFKRMDIHGFYMNKLVILTAVMSDWGEADKQTLVDRLVAVCDTLKETNEVYLFDSSKLLAAEYANTLSFYGQVIYQDQKIHVADLMSVIMGDYVESTAENINKDVKPKGFFSKFLKGRKGGTAPVAVEEPKQEDTPAPVEPGVVLPSNNEADSPSGFDDAPLFESAENESSVHVSLSKSNNVDEDLDALQLPEDKPQYLTEDNITATGNLNDNPLFEEPSPKPQSVETVPAPSPIPEPVKVVAPAPAQVKQKIEIPQPSGKYIQFFQKRTKIILCTGERRSGVSTFTSNIAQQVQRDGLSCLLVDLDYERRGQSINFPFEHDSDDVHLTYSLYNAVKSNSSIGEHAIALDDGLDFLGTSLYVEDTDMMHNHVTNETLQRLLTVALSEYDIILIDCPFVQIKEYPCLVAMSNLIVHSMCTDIRSIYNTLNSITEYDFASSTDYNLYVSKMMLLLNCYTAHFWNHTEVTEKFLPRVMFELTDSQMYLNFAVLGRVPFFADYDEYMSGGKMLVDNAKYRNIFVHLLDELALRG